jgi:hypothetical protein
VTERIVDAFEVIEVEEQARHLVPVARRLSDDLPEPLVEQRAVRKAGEDIVLRELVGLRSRNLQLLGALSDLFLEGALIGRDLGLRFEQAVRHVIEGVRQQAELVARGHRHVDVELAGADRAHGAHQLPNRCCDKLPREQQRDDNSDEREASHDR